MTLGLGTAPFSVKLASIENINGQAITDANRHKGKVNGPADMKGFVFGVPFPYSMHNLLLRYYLAKGGVDPDKDVQIRPVPPPDSIAQLVAGDIDAYLMPDPLIKGLFTKMQVLYIFLLKNYGQVIHVVLLQQGNHG